MSDLKLSEAIRLGSMLGPQAFGAEHRRQRVPGWRGWLLGRTQGATCAFGAALQAHPCGSRPRVGTVESLRGVAGDVDRVLDPPAIWLAVLGIHTVCPVCLARPAVVESVFRLIAHLNDDHKWTREQIADWLTAFERIAEAETDYVEPVAEVLCR